MEKKGRERRQFFKFAGASIAGPLAHVFPQAASPVRLAEPTAVTDVQVAGLPANWAGIHWQWEWPCWVASAGRQFSMQDYVSGLLSAGVQVIHIVTRLERGVFHFPTRIGFERDCTGRDWVLEVLQEIRRQRAEDRLKVLLYFTPSLDSSAARARPTWQQLDKDGLPLAFPGMFDQPLWGYVCMNSPWRDYFISIINEAAQLYADAYSNTVGFFVDTPHFAMFGCYCRWCQDGYRAQYGADLPRDPYVGRDLWFNMYRFQTQSLLRFLEDINRQVIARRPRLAWTWNATSLQHNWEPRLWQVAYYNSTEGELSYLWTLAWSKQMASYGKPFEISFGRDQSWTNQRPRPVHELKTRAGITVAHGGGVLIGDYPYPSGQLRANALTWGNEIFRWKNSIQPWLDGAKGLSEVAVFDSFDSNWVRFILSYNEDGLGIWGDDKPPNSSLYAWVKLLAMTNIQFDVVTENNLNTLSKYKVVILPDLPYLSDATIQALDRYVQAGGNLLSTYRTGLFDRSGVQNPSASLFTMFGVQLRQWSTYYGNYLWLDDAPLQRELSPEPLLILGLTLLCEATTARPLAWVTFPIEELTPDRQVWSDYNPPRDTHETFASIALNRRGQGQVLSIFHPLEDAIRTQDYWAAERLLLNALTRLLPDRVIKVTASGEVIAFTMLQQDRRRVVAHLFNEALWESLWTGNVILSGLAKYGVRGTESQVSWKRPPVANVQIEVKAPFAVARVYEAPSRRSLPFQTVGGVVRFTVPSVDTHSVVVLEA